MLRFVLPIRLSLSAHSEMKTFIFIVKYKLIHRPGMYKVYKGIPITFCYDFRFRFCRHFIKCAFHSECCHRWFSSEWLTSVVILEPTWLRHIFQQTHFSLSLTHIHTYSQTYNPMGLLWTKPIKWKLSHWIMFRNYYLNFELFARRKLGSSGRWNRCASSTQPIICTCKTDVLFALANFHRNTTGKNSEERTGWKHLSYSEMIGLNAFCQFSRKSPLIWNVPIEYVQMDWEMEGRGQ